MTNRITPAQIRGARAMLDWSMLDLAGAAGVSISTVKRIEGSSPQPVSEDTISLVRAALERAGIGFNSEGHRSIGIVLHVVGPG